MIQASVCSCLPLTSGLASSSSSVVRFGLAGDTRACSREHRWPAAGRREGSRPRNGTSAPAGGPPVISGLVPAGGDVGGAEAEREFH